MSVTAIRPLTAAVWSLMADLAISATIARGFLDVAEVENNHERVRAGRLATRERNRRGRVVTFVKL